MNRRYLLKVTLATAVGADYDEASATISRFDKKQSNAVHIVFSA